MSNEPVGGGSEPPPSVQPPMGDTPSFGIGAPSFPPPGFPGKVGGLDSQPHFFRNGYWVAWNGQHWWNGSAWILGPPPVGTAAAGPGAGGAGGAVAAIVSLIGFVIFAGVFFAVCQSMPSTPGLGP